MNDLDYEYIILLLLIEGMEGFRRTLLEGILKSLSEEIIHI
jgi:hypothetical protein